MAHVHARQPARIPQPLAQHLQVTPETAAYLEDLRRPSLSHPIEQPAVRLVKFTLIHLTGEPVGPPFPESLGVVSAPKERQPAILEADEPPHNAESRKEDLEPAGHPPTSSRTPVPDRPAALALRRVRSAT